jgi:uncharacterized membrane protein
MMMRMLVSAIHQTSIEGRSGPLPPPEDYAKYDTVCPGSANRILAMAEKEQEHRHHCENAVVSIHSVNIPAGREERKRGQLFAFVVCIVSLLVGGAIVGFSQATVAQIGGTVFGVGALGSIVVAFMTGKRANGEAAPSPATPATPPQPPA